MSVEFASATLFIKSATNLKDQFNKVCQIQDALLLLSISVATNEDIDEYSLDDGQTKIRVSYRGVEDIIKSYNSLEAVKQMLLNQLNGRQMSLKDAGSLNPVHRRRRHGH